MILDRLAPTRVRDKERRAQELNALALQSRPEVVSALLAATADRGLELERLRLNLNLTEQALQKILSAFDIVILSKDPRIAMLSSSYQALHERVLAVLEAQQPVNPTGSGLSVQQLLKSCAPLMQQKVFLQALRSALFLKDLAFSGSLVILRKHLSTTQAADEVLWQKVEPALTRLGVKTLTVEGLAIELNLKKLVLNEFLHRQVKLGRVFRVSSDRFYLRALMIHFATLATQLAQQHPEHTFIAAQFRDQAGINRTQAIEILDVLDRLGVTQRVGDKRRLLKPLERVFE